MPSFRFRPVSATVALACTVGSLSCAGGPTPEVAGPDHMFEHFGQVAEIQSALILGDMEATRSPARRLATHRGDNVPPEGSDAIETMRNEARILGQQDGVLEVARSLGRMGVACGSCHRATGTDLQLTMESPPPQASGGAGHMQRHAWGMDRLWEGLFAPSDAAWGSGAGALLGMPSDFGSNDQANRLAKRVHDLGRKAQGAQSAQDRVGVYAELIETCSLCHATLGLRIRQ